MLNWFTLVIIFASNSLCLNKAVGNTKKSSCTKFISSGNCIEHKSQNFCCLPIKLSEENCDGCETESFCCPEHHCCFRNQTKLSSRKSSNETSVEGESPFQWQHYYEVFIILAILFAVCICCLKNQKAVPPSVPYQRHHGRDFEGTPRREEQRNQVLENDSPPLYHDVIKDMNSFPTYPADNV